MGNVAFSRALGTLGNAVQGETFDDSYKNLRVVRGLVTMSASYATGGDSIVHGQVGLREIQRMLIDTGRGLHTCGMSLQLANANPAAAKMLVYDANGVEVANATDLSTRVPVPVWFLGI